MKTLIKFNPNAFIIILFAIILSTPVIAQEYHTIRVNGSILLVEKNSELQRGTIFEENDSLVFKTYNSLATVVHPEKGRFILRPDNVDLAYAKASYTPALSNIQSRTIDANFSEEYDDIDLSQVKASFTPAIANISSRSSSLNSLDELQNHFNGKYAIVDDIRLNINPDKFPMSQEKFFFIRYEYNNEPVFKQLSSEDDTLIIKKIELFSVDGEKLNDPEAVKEMEVWYLERDNDNNITYIGTFEPVFVDNDELYEEISIMINVFHEKSRDELLAEILSFINEVYGKPNRKSVEVWLSNNTEF